MIATDLINSVSERLTNVEKSIRRDGRKIIMTVRKGKQKLTIHAEKEVTIKVGFNKPKKVDFNTEAVLKVIKADLGLF